MLISAHVFNTVVCFPRWCCIFQYKPTLWYMYVYHFLQWWNLRIMATHCMKRENMSYSIAYIFQTGADIKLQFLDISKINRFYWLLKKNWLEVPFKTTQEIMIHSSNMYLVHVGEIQITNYHSYMLERYKLPITITSYNWLQGVVYNPHIFFQNISYSVN